jgi:hypothetical protein
MIVYVAIEKSNVCLQYNFTSGKVPPPKKKKQTNKQNKTKKKENQV